MLNLFSNKSLNICIKQTFLNKNKMNNSYNNYDSNYDSNCESFPVFCSKCNKDTTIRLMTDMCFWYKGDCGHSSSWQDCPKNFPTIKTEFNNESQVFCNKNS